MGLGLGSLHPDRLDLPLLSLGPILRINGLQFPPTHSHDLSSNSRYANHTM
ncbi:hypothetical protein HanXRQr2_Chr13g0572921 [Helianthus annuus]|uniref:Uncharacterized protein n=1 Tax=Helianthus annuus TaxID=4232 RepID=A0A9K3EEL4_HELAN|nr:hypothetical protein HanXRQr2_Chr13g0572921 [Helianthus annuus]